MQTVVETPPYLADAERLFTAAERKTIVETLAADPRCGVVIPGSGGIRKVRFGFGGRGKSGGARVIYVYGGDDVPIFLLAVLPKTRSPIWPRTSGSRSERRSPACWRIIGG